MNKDYFMEFFLQVSIILSLLKSDYRDLTLYNQLNTLHDDFNGDLAVLSVVDSRGLIGQNVDIGHVHPKNARIEDVLRSIHSLGRHEYFRGISSDVVNAFLVDESSGVGHSSASANGAASRSSCGVENGLSCQNSAAEEEPTKEDVDLMDVLWRYDVDLEVNVNPSLMFELETELEVPLLSNLEEEAVAFMEKQESQTSTFISNLQEDLDANYREHSSTELNTPEVLENSGFSFFNEEENIESNWTSLMNLFGVENNTGNDVEVEMFSNLFDLHGNEQMKNEETTQCNDTALLNPSDDMDLSIYNDPVLERSIGLFDDLGVDLDYNEIPGLTYCDINDSSSSGLVGFTGEATPRSATASATDHSFYDVYARDESAYAPSESKYSMSDRVSSRCSFSSDSLLAGCTGTSAMWASAGDINHDHTYNTKPPHEPHEEDDDENSNDYKQMRATRSKDEVKLKQLAIPFSLEEVINNPIEWFTNVTTSPKYGLSAEQVELLRAIRKRGKNKEAAQNCRKRKLDEIQSLEIDVDALTSKKSELEKNCFYLENSLDKLTRKFTELQEKILTSVRNSQKFDNTDISLQFDRLGILRVTEGTQHDKWNSTTSDGSSRNLSKSKRKQQKRN